MYIGDLFEHESKKYYLGDGIQNYFAMAKNLTDLYHLEPGGKNSGNKIEMITGDTKVDFISSSVVNFRKFNKLKESRYFDGEKD